MQRQALGPVRDLQSLPLAFDHPAAASLLLRRQIRRRLRTTRAGFLPQALIDGFLTINLLRLRLGDGG